jgi:hypothetical protein
MKIAICAIAYNRLDSIKRLLDSLLKAYYRSEVTLIISIDKSNTDEVEKYANAFDWKYGEKRVIAHKTNLGLKKHILSIGDFLYEFDAIVVLEDDIIVAPNFFNYTLEAVEKYQDDLTIAGISLYNYPQCIHKWQPFLPLQTDSDVYLMKVAVSWGQVWMRKQWQDFMKWYEKNNCEFSYFSHLPKTICSWGKQSWLKYHMRYCIEENKYFLFPYISLSTNNSDKGTHNSRKLTIFQTPLLYGEKCNYRFNPTIRYDAFFENEFLGDILKIAQKDLCVDFYGYKTNALKAKYWLTTRICDYRIIKSFSLEQRPYEYNIINNIEGNDLFLYDTEVKEKNTIRGGFNIRRYLFFLEYINNFQIRSLFSNFLKVLINK